MMAEGGRPRLGRGLAALIGENAHRTEQGPAQPPRRAPVEMLRPNPRNPRRSFDPTALDELTASIREKGLIQPIVVRPSPEGADGYEIIAGERRWRAAQKAGLHETPIVVIEASDKDVLEYAIIENVQRADLNALDEAQGYLRLMEEFEYTQNDLARVIGKSRSHVANTLRLMVLPDEVKTMITDGALSSGHGRALIGHRDAIALARRIAQDGLSVREAERLTAERANPAAPPPASKASRAPREKDADTRALERRLSDALGLGVAIEARDGEGGEMRIRYATLEQLDGLIDRLAAP